MKITLDIPDSSRAVFINLLYIAPDEHGMWKRECVKTRTLVELQNGMKISMKDDAKHEQDE